MARASERSRAKWTAARVKKNVQKQEAEIAVLIQSEPQML
jgi:hypothetical protein